jgi:hypothetical protein
LPHAFEVDSGQSRAPACWPSGLSDQSGPVRSQVALRVYPRKVGRLAPTCATMAPRPGRQHAASSRSYQRLQNNSVSLSGSNPSRSAYRPERNSTERRSRAGRSVWTGRSVWNGVAERAAIPRSFLRRAQQPPVRRATARAFNGEHRPAKAVLSTSPCSVWNAS